MTTSSITRASVEELAARPYGVDAGEFIRFRMDANDDAVASVVRAVASGDSSSCEEFRAALHELDIDTLRLFAMRRTLQGRRQASLGLLSESMDAFALLPRMSDVPWDSWFRANLYLARTLGADLDLVGRRVRDLASSASGDRGDVVLEAMSRVNDLAQCRLVEVSTTYGTGFVEILVFRNSPSLGLFGAPSRLGVNEIDYRPASNLAQLAAGFADALDVDHEVRSGPLGQDQLAATFFELIVPGSYVTSTGCLSFVADRVDARGSFTAFVAELPPDSAVEDLVAAAEKIEGQVAVSDGRRLILLSAQPSFDEENDVVVDVERYRDAASVALRDPATTSWLPG